MTRQKPLRALDPIELTKYIDPDLEFLNILRKSVCDVYLVENKGKPAVLKIDRYLAEDNGHAKNEGKALEALEGIVGAPRLYDKYESGTAGNGYHAILKEYIHGYPLDHLSNFWIKETTDFQKKIERFIREMGERNVVFTFVGDLIGENVYVNNKQPYFIDLGFTMVASEEERKKPEFQEFKEEQYQKIKVLFFPNL